MSKKKIKLNKPKKKAIKFLDMKNIADLNQAIENANFICESKPDKFNIVRSLKDNLYHIFFSDKEIDEKKYELCLVVYPTFKGYDKALLYAITQAKKTESKIAICGRHINKTNVWTVYPLAVKLSKISENETMSIIDRYGNFLGWKKDLDLN